LTHPVDLLSPLPLLLLPLLRMADCVRSTTPAARDHSPVGTSERRVAQSVQDRVDGTVDVAHPVHMSVQDRVDGAVDVAQPVRRAYRTGLTVLSMWLSQYTERTGPG